MKQIVVTVLKSGGDFRPEHVERMRKLVPNYYDMVCLTDIPFDIKGVKTENLIWDLPGWWSKMELFRPSFLEGQDFLYLDLDITLFGLARKYFDCKTSMMLKDWQNDMSNSSVMFIRAEDKKYVWSEFFPTMDVSCPFGDQKVIGELLPHCYWQDDFPDEFFSFKTHLYPYNEMYKGGFKETCRVLCYHGKPRPWKEIDQ